MDPWAEPARRNTTRTADRGVFLLPLVIGGEGLEIGPFLNSLGLGSVVTVGFTCSGTTPMRIKRIDDLDDARELWA